METSVHDSPLPLGSSLQPSLIPSTNTTFSTTSSTSSKSITITSLPPSPFDELFEFILPESRLDVVLEALNLILGISKDPLLVLFLTQSHRPSLSHLQSWTKANFEFISPYLPTQVIPHPQVSLQSKIVHVSLSILINLTVNSNLDLVSKLGTADYVHDLMHMILVRDSRYSSSSIYHFGVFQILAQC